MYIKCHTFGTYPYQRHVHASRPWWYELNQNNTRYVLALWRSSHPVYSYIHYQIMYMTPSCTWSTIHVTLTLPKTCPCIKALDDMNGITCPSSLLCFIFFAVQHQNLLGHQAIVLPSYSACWNPNWTAPSHCLSSDDVGTIQWMSHQEMLCM